MADASTALHELVRRALARALGLTDTNFFRPDGQRAPAGAANAPYATVKLYGATMASYNLRRYEVTDPAVEDVVPADPGDADLLEALEAMTEFTASVQFFRDGAVDGAGRPAWGEGAFDRAKRLVMRIEMSDAAMYLAGLGLAYVSASQVRDLSAVADGSNERRAQVDLTFYVADAEVALMNMFKTATFAVEVQQPDGHIDEVSA